MGEDSGQASMTELRRSLNFTKPDGENVFYCFICRALLGYPIHTKDGSTSCDTTAGDVFADRTLRELAYIPNSNVHHHTLIAEAVPELEKRFRDFVFFHSERIVPEYIIAYKRA